MGLAARATSPLQICFVLSVRTLVALLPSVSHRQRWEQALQLLAPRASTTNSSRALPPDEGVQVSQPLSESAAKQVCL
jgi:hypothetical protein